MSKTQIRSSLKFKPLYTTEKRYIILTGGRGSSKSFESSLFAACLTYELNQRILLTRYTMVSAEISIIPEFKEKIRLLNAEDTFQVTNSSIVNKTNGSDIIFRGIKASSGIQTANLKSISGVTTWVIDEAEELVDEDIFDTIDLSIRVKDIQNRVIIIMNPSNKDHWVYKRWIANHSKVVYIDGYPIEISTHPDVLHIHTTYMDNLRNLNEKFIQQQRERKVSSPKWYGHKIIGQWNEVSEGAIFSTELLKFYKPSESLEFETSIAYIDVADEGTDYLCLVIGKHIGSQLHIVDVVFSDLNADATIPMCVEALKRNNVSICRVESNSMGGMYGRAIEKICDTQILLINNSTNKHTRILMEAPFIYSFCNFIHESERSGMYQAYMNQLYRYTKDGKTDHDDAADATSGLTLFVRNYLSYLYE